MNELGINQKGIISGNDVYKYVPTSQRQFFQRQETATKELGNTLEDDNKHVPLLYWTSKQHKTLISLGLFPVQVTAQIKPFLLM